LPAAKLFFCFVFFIMLNGEAMAQAPLLTDVSVNYRAHGTTFLLSEGDEYFAAISDLRKWGVRGPYVDTVEYDGREFARLLSLGDVEISYDPQNVSLVLNFPPELLPHQQTNLSRRRNSDAVSGTGAYLDYDWSYISSDESYANGLLAPTFFSPAGVFSTQVLYQGYDPPPDELVGFQRRTEDWVRLDTTYTRDFPDKMRSLQIGDVIQRPGIWGNALRVGGVQVASNFAMQPGFISFPLPTLHGAAGLPSTLDLYVNGALHHRQNLEAGPFQVDEIPIVTGSGQVQMVVTDILGRQQTYAQSFYASSELLRPGLSEYSYTLGALRADFGYVSNNYDDAVVIADHRYGVTNGLTVGGKAEFSKDTKQITATVDWSPNLSGILSFGLGASRKDSTTGSAWSVGYEYRTQQFNVAARASGSSEEFGVVTVYDYNTLPETQLTVSGGWHVPVVGSFGAALAHLDYHDRPTRDVITLSHNHSLFGRYSLSSFVSYTKEKFSDTYVGVTVNTRFGARRSASARVSRSGGDTEVRMDTQSSLPAGPGFAYRVGTTIGERDRFDAGLIGQTGFGSYTLDVDRFDDKTSYRTGTRGSVAWLAGRPYFAREINDGFAVARVGDLENVRIYVENQEIGQSDKHGRLLLPRLRPYELNRVRIEPNDLPLASEVPTVSMEVTPAFRSGLVISFPVATPSFAMVRAVLPGGNSIPEGAAVRLSGKEETTIVGLDGTVYLSGPEGHAEVTIEWSAHRCNFDVELPSPSQALPHLGDVICGTGQ